MINIHTIIYNGRGLSLNQAYTLHWAKSKKIKDEIKASLTGLIKLASLPKIKKFRLHVAFNARYDCDNIIPVLKLFVDCLRYELVIAEDTKDIYSGFSVDYDSSLKRNDYVFTIQELDI